MAANEPSAAIWREFDALAEDALLLCDQHISDEVRREAQRRIIERVQDREHDAPTSGGSSELRVPRHAPAVARRHP